jgi:hypothetical protein
MLPSVNFASLLGNINYLPLAGTGDQMPTGLQAEESGITPGHITSSSANNTLPVVDRLDEEILRAAARALGLSHINLPSLQQQQQHEPKADQLLAPPATQRTADDSSPGALRDTGGYKRGAASPIQPLYRHHGTQDDDAGGVLVAGEAVAAGTAYAAVPVEVEGREALDGVPLTSPAPLHQLNQNGSASQLSNRRQGTPAAAVEEELDADTETEGERQVPLFIQTSGLIANVSMV